MQLKLGQAKSANRDALRALQHTNNVRKLILGGKKIDKTLFSAVGALSRSMATLLSAHKGWYDPKDLKEMADKNGYVELIFRIPWGDLLECENIDGLNNWVDDEVLDSCNYTLSDLTYKLVGVDIQNGYLYFRVTADAREIIEDYEERLEEEAEAADDEEQARDRRKGLYGPTVKGEKF